MSRIAHYLQEHLLGEVITNPEVRRHFAHDGSIFQLLPQMVVYPRSESDVRKTARFAWQLAERGRVIPITARGAGSDTSGAALGSGIMLVFPAHLNRLVALDPKKLTATVEPGITYAELQMALQMHGLFFPPYPASQRYATLGGGLANNAIGEKSVKYGATLDHVDSLRVVLANGEVIKTGLLDKKGLSHKMGLANMEGQIYRALDKLIEENERLLQAHRDRFKARFSSTGYNLFDVKRGDRFDLTPLIIGSQGTLGLITEATLRLTSQNPSSQLALIGLDNFDDLNELLPKILEFQPSGLEMVNRPLVEQLRQASPNHFAGGPELPSAAVYLIIEFDDAKTAEAQLKALAKLLDKPAGFYQVAASAAEREPIWKLRHSPAALAAHANGPAKPLPVAEDISVPVERAAEFLQRAAGLYRENDLPPAAAAHLGSGVILLQPMLDLANLGDRQKLVRLSNSLYELAAEFGGSPSAARGDGRSRTPYLESYFGGEIYHLMLAVKEIFDPYGMLNPGVKTGTTQEQAIELLRSEYNLDHRHLHLPRS